MKVVYFFDKDSTQCPVKKYLEQFISNKKDTNKDNQRKNKLLAEIDQKIEYIRERNGKATPPIAKPLMGYKFFEIRGGKYKNIVVRICYCCYQDMMVLLSAFEKPDNYETEKEKRKIKRELEETNNRYKQFLLKPTNYEKYN